MQRVSEAAVYYGHINKQILADSPELILKRFNLLREDGQLTNAAVVLFCKEMPIDYSNCEMKLAAFNSIRREHIIDSRIVPGNLFTLLEEADTFIRRHTPISSWIPPDQFERIDQPAYVFEALREAVINALCHRNYHGPSSVSVMFYQDRLEITSFGHLLPPLTISNLLSQAQSFPRNEKIAQVLYLCGEIERFGSGLQKIFQLCEQAGAAAPRLEENNAFFHHVYSSRSLTFGQGTAKTHTVPAGVIRTSKAHLKTIIRRICTACPRDYEAV